MKISRRMLRDISVTKKLYIIVGTMAVLIAVELVTLWFSMQTLSSVRAFVGGEGLWSKSQKDASYALREYSLTRDERHYLAFQKFMQVPMGDHKTLVELLKPEPDYAIARQGFLEGRIHADDIDGAINLMRRFQSIYYINEATKIWIKGDSLIGFLPPLGQAMHAEFQKPEPSQRVVDSLVAQIEPLNAKLTVLEDNFSAILGEGSRWLENLVLKLLLIVALTVEVTGLGMSISVSRGISRGLHAINRAARRVSKGDLTDRAEIYSNDEIGQVAAAMNQMTEHLIKRNKDLEQFAYIISHNLRGPVTNVLSLAALLEEPRLDKETRQECLDGVVLSVRSLDETLTDLSRILQVKGDLTTQTENVRFADVVNDITRSISELVHAEHANVQTDFTEVEEINTVKGYLTSIFHNLIINSIKYRRKDVPPVLTIRSQRVNGRTRLTFADNGMGIDLHRHRERVFGLYRRFQTSIPGKGLGLFMVKTQVEALGGNVTVDSKLGEGTVFTIDL